MSACCLCGADASPSDESWTGSVEALPDPVSVCSEACREQLGWIILKGPPFGSAASGPRNDAGAKRQKTR